MEPQRKSTPASGNTTKKEECDSANSNDDKSTHKELHQQISEKVNVKYCAF